MVGHKTMLGGAGHAPQGKIYKKLELISRYMWRGVSAEVVILGVVRRSMEYFWVGRIMGFV